ncbi:MAG: hypothetical protein AB8H47_03115 [Bacteroidia bacterium]
MQLAETKAISESVHFGPANSLSFTLKVDDTIVKVSGQFAEGRIVIALPEGQAQHWINSQEVGIEVQSEISPEHQLHILIEKDFPCLDREGEDKADTFWELAPETPESC